MRTTPPTKGFSTMASVFKRKADRQRKGSPWYLAYRDAEGRRRTVKGCPDKAATERMAAKLESDAALRREGLVDPKDDAYRRHAARPAADHLADWGADIRARGKTPKYASLTIA